MLCVCKAHGSRPITHRRSGSALFATAQSSLPAVQDCLERKKVAGASFRFMKCHWLWAAGTFTAGDLAQRVRRACTDCVEQRQCQGDCGFRQPEVRQTAAHAPRRSPRRRHALGAVTPSRSATPPLGRGLAPIQPSLPRVLRSSTSHEDLPQERRRRAGAQLLSSGVGSSPPTESVSFALPPSWRPGLACSARCRSQTSQSPCMRAIRRAQFAPASSKGRGKCKEQKLVRRLISLAFTAEVEAGAIVRMVHV